MDAKQNKERYKKSILFFCGITILLIGSGILAGQLYLEDLTGPTIMFVFAVAFLNLAFWFRKNWWALIPGGLLLSGGVAAALDILLPDSNITGPIFLILLSASFISIAVLSSKNWWAIIPGGTFFSISLVAILENFIPHQDFPSIQHAFKFGVYTWVLVFGLASTFGILWLLRKKYSTNWAKYPAAGLLAVAVLALILGHHFGEIWWASLLLGGGVMALLSVLPGKNTQSVG